MIQAGKIVVLRQVRGDFPFSRIVAEPGVYCPFINRYGAVSVDVGNGEQLGLKPDEFQWLDKPPAELFERQ